MVRILAGDHQPISHVDVKCNSKVELHVASSSQDALFIVKPGKHITFGIAIKSVDRFKKTGKYFE